MSVGSKDRHEPRADTGWTGGAYAISRVALAVAVALEAAEPDATPWLGGPWTRAVAVALAACFALGVRSRTTAALSAAVVLAGHLETALVDWPFGALVALTAHAGIPSAPFLSWDARGRGDPAGSWHLPAGVARFAAFGVAAALVARGALSTDGGARETAMLVVVAVVSVAIAASTTLGRGSARAWALGVVALAIAAALPGWPAPSPSAWALWLLAARPSWIPPRRSSQPPDVVLYDGSCGLCHRSVRFLIAEDPSPSGTFRFAPLDGETAASLGVVPPNGRSGTVIVRRPDGVRLERAAAVFYLWDRLGGVWRALATIGRVVPRPLADSGYRVVASVRRALFPRPDTACPRVSSELRERMLD